MKKNEDGNQENYNSDKTKLAAGTERIKGIYQKNNHKINHKDSE